MILFDMIYAGTEATMTSLKWMLVYLMHWPEYQVKLLNDILENAQNTSHPYLKNKYNFNFVQEFIHEPLRFSSVIPICPPHKTLSDEKIESYNIARGITVLHNEALPVIPSIVTPSRPNFISLHTATP